ncbi:YkgJ family cysteine cluster protein [Desulfogranum marinum]|uniref:YkgJ family cysteine cluster protein n=1 Tax=Desulfogranum marinum TaxID=453220 RepID=UPI0019643C0F|nr:YkgJ family cysteine cluster protein [Desulfogranum marinum]MBM9511203.1 YkgJ family cysteine cluster protein [Desulfogranum marinum]
MGQANPPDMLLEGRTLVDKGPFTFHCHPGVSCYLKCCHNAEIYLFPYDVLRLKQHLNLHSAQFLRQYTRIGEGSHPFFPGVMLNMASAEGLPCPFLSNEGCTVYRDRPSACRTYPLERAVEQLNDTTRLKVHYFMTHHPYCKGHFEQKTYTIKKWERDQGLYEFNLFNELWAEVDAFFASNPWRGEGEAGPLQQLAFMACYNIDDFRSYVEQHRLVQQFRVDKVVRNRIKKDDSALLKFGFQWLQFYLGRKPTLVPK